MTGPHRTIDLHNAPAGRAAPHRHPGYPPEPQRPRNPLAFTFIACVNDETQYDTCIRYLDKLEVPSGHTVETTAVIGATSMAEGYQLAMEASTARYKIYVHQDVYLIHRGLLPELVDLFRKYPRLGLVGVVGATRIPSSVLYSVNNPLHSFGRSWDYRRPGGLSVLLGRANSRRLHLSRFRSFVGNYLPAVVVDGFFLATQYDIPWTNQLGGFGLYDQAQSLEFIKAGLEVGIARQETIWCIHWGPLQERTHEQERRLHIERRQKAAVFRGLYPAFIGVPARRLYEQYQGAVRQSGLFIAESGSGTMDRQSKPEDLKSFHQAQERLGVIIVTFSGREALLRALRALLPQCDALQEVESRIIVVDNASTDGTTEAVRQEFPQVIVIASPASGGLAGAFNVGLRELSFPSYVLVTRDDAEFSEGALARMISYLRGRSSTAGVVASFVDPDGAVDLLPPRSRQPQPITHVDTTCALIRGEVFFDVGLYDERFSSCHESLDWSLRAKRKGYKFAHLAEARVLQYRSDRQRQEGPAVFTERSVANLRLVYKHAGRRWAAALYWIQRIWARWLAFRWRHDSEAVRQISEAMAQATSLYRKFREENKRPELL